MKGADEMTDKNPTAADFVLAAAMDAANCAAAKTDDEARKFAADAVETSVAAAASTAK